MINLSSFEFFKSGFLTVYLEDDEVIRNLFKSVRDTNQMSQSQLIEAGKKAASGMVNRQFGFSSGLETKKYANRTFRRRV